MAASSSNAIRDESSEILLGRMEGFMTPKFCSEEQPDRTTVKNLFRLGSNLAEEETFPEFLARIGGASALSSMELRDSTCLFDLMPSVAVLQRILRYFPRSETQPAIRMAPFCVHRALQRHDIALAQALVKAGAITTCLDADNRSPLSYSCSVTVAEEEVDRFVAFLKQIAHPSLLWVPSACGRMPLHFAIQAGNLAALDFLLDSGCLPSIQDLRHTLRFPQVFRRLFRSQDMSRAQLIFELLGTQGTEEEQRFIGQRKREFPSLQSSVPRLVLGTPQANCFYQVKQVLLRHQETPFNKASFSSELKDACPGKASIPFFASDDLDQCMTLLHFVPNNQVLRFVQQLIPQTALNLNNLELRSPLAHCCFLGRWDVALELLSQGADVKSTDVQGNTPLLVACMGNNLESCPAELVQRICSINPSVSNRASARGETPLMLSLAASRLDIVRILLASGACISATDQEGRSVFHVLAHIPRSCALEQLVREMVFGNEWMIHKRGRECDSPFGEALTQGKSFLTKIYNSMILDSLLRSIRAEERSSPTSVALAEVWAVQLSSFYKIACRLPGKLASTQLPWTNPSSPFQESFLNHFCRLTYPTLMCYYDREFSIQNSGLEFVCKEVQSQAPAALFFSEKKAQPWSIATTSGQAFLVRAKELLDQFYDEPCFRTKLAKFEEFMAFTRIEFTTLNGPPEPSDLFTLRSYWIALCPRSNIQSHFTYIEQFFVDMPPESSISLLAPATLLTLADPDRGAKLIIRNGLPIDTPDVALCSVLEGFLSVVGSPSFHSERPSSFKIPFPSSHSFPAVRHLFNRFDDLKCELVDEEVEFRIDPQFFFFERAVWVRIAMSLADGTIYNS